MSNGFDFRFVRFFRKQYPFETRLIFFFSLFIIVSVSFTYLVSNSIFLNTITRQLNYFSVETMRDRTNLLDISMREKDASFLTGGLSKGALARGMSEPGRQYALYIHHSTMHKDGYLYITDNGTYQETLEVTLSPGRYTAEWTLPEDGRCLESVSFTHSGGRYACRPPCTRSISP